eukprot:2789757-Lingulodinium_polyedra.AAC.1
MSGGFCLSLSREQIGFGTVAQFGLSAQSLNLSVTQPCSQPDRVSQSGSQSPESDQILIRI